MENLDMETDMENDSDGTYTSNKEVNSKKFVLEKYMCTEDGCNQRFGKLDKLDRHIYHHTKIKTHKCNIGECDKSYITISNLNKHKKSFHEQIRSARNIKCDIESCPKLFICNHDKNRHVMNLHENPKLYVCPDCKQHFKQKNQLRRHRVIHTGNFPHKCNDCSKGFTTKKSLESHLRVHRKYTCQFCSMELNKWSEMVKHKRAEHIFSYKCEICDKSFKKQYRLKVHLETHKSKQERLVFPCPYEACEKFFFHASNLKFHIKVNHEGKKLKCTFEGCNKELSTKSRYNKHLLLHTKKPQALDKKRKLKKKKRSDLGEKKLSTTSLLSGIRLNPSLEKKIINGENLSVEIHIPDNIADVIEHSLSN